MAKSPVRMVAVVVVLVAAASAAVALALSPRTDTSTGIPSTSRAAIASVPAPSTASAAPSAHAPQGPSSGNGEAAPSEPAPVASAQRTQAPSGANGEADPTMHAPTGTTATTAPAVPPAAPHSEANAAVPLAADSPWLTRIDSAPLASNSQAVVANLSEQIDNYWGGVAAFNTKYYNNAFYPVMDATAGQRVGFFDCHGLGYTPDNLFDGEAYFLNVPIPRGATPAAGSDHIMSVYNSESDQLWEFWNVRQTAAGGYEACWGGRIDHVSSSPGYFPAPYGATATGLSISAGMISMTEVKSGRINHAMYLLTRQAQPRTRLSWPAQRGDGQLDDPNVVRQGQRLRLDPSLDLSAYDLTPIGHMVAVAAQEYGFIVADTSGAVGVVGESGNRYIAQTGADPWDQILQGQQGEALRNFPWHHLQAIQVDYGKP